LSFTLHNKEAKLLPPDTFLSGKNAPKCVCGRGSAPDPAGGAYSAPPDPIAGNRGRPPEGGGKGRGGRGKGTEEDRRGGEREGNGKGYPPERKSWLRPCPQRAVLVHTTR